MCCVCSIGLRNLLAQLAAPATASGTAPSHCHQLCVLTTWTVTGALNRSDDFLETAQSPSSLPKDKHRLLFRAHLHPSHMPAVQGTSCGYMG